MRNHGPWYLPVRRFAIWMIAAILISGCSLFGDDDEEELVPTELLDFDETLDVRRLWSTKLGGGTEFLRIALSPAGDGDRIYAASYDGNVYAFDPENGRRIWRTEVDVILSAGPGVGEGLVVVAGYDGDLMAANKLQQASFVSADVAGPPVSKQNHIARFNFGRLDKPAMQRRTVQTRKTDVFETKSR